MKKIIAGLLTAVALHAPVAKAEAVRDVLVGINYFAGWWEELPNKWHGKGWVATEADWRPQFPERLPLLGCYNNQTTMDQEIVAASSHGVDFFAMLWYFSPDGGEQGVSAERLNRGLIHFQRSPNARLMKFIVEYCNHAQFNATTDEQWEACLKVWVEAMRHPSYLRVGGRLVFKFHDAYQFWMKNGQDLARCQARLETLRRRVREAGLGEMLIGGGVMAFTQVPPGSFPTRLFDFTATYMDIPTVEIREKEHPYALLAAQAREARVRHAADPIPWVPYLTAGWNPRPWTHPKADDAHRRFFTFPTRAEWSEELRLIKEDFNRFPTLGLPLPNGGRQKILSIYAWNEFGEGGIMAPTKADGSMKLECIQTVFGTNPP